MARNLEHLDPAALSAWIRNLAEQKVITDDVADVLVESVVIGCRDWEKGVPVIVIRAKLGWSPKQVTP
jgi:hypothetical protein